MWYTCLNELCNLNGSKITDWNEYSRVLMRLVVSCVWSNSTAPQTDAADDLQTTRPSKMRIYECKHACPLQYLKPQFIISIIRRVDTNNKNWPMLEMKGICQSRLPFLIQFCAFLIQHYTAPTLGNLICEDFHPIWHIKPKHL